MPGMLKLGLDEPVGSRADAGYQLDVGRVIGQTFLGRVFLVSLLVGIVTLVGPLRCIVPGIIVMCMNWVAVPVAVIESPGIRASLDRSHQLRVHREGADVADLVRVFE